MSDIIGIQAKLSARFDLYGAIHRGLRKAEMDMLARVGALDASDDHAIAAMIADFRALLVLARFHLFDESEYIHRAIDERQPGTSALATENLDGHTRSFAELEDLASKLESATNPYREVLLKSLYLRYSQFVADDFRQMLVEETELQPILHRLFSDEELADIQSRIIASIPPDFMLRFLAIMVPAVDSDARFQLINAMKARNSPDAFRSLLYEVVKPSLSQVDWRSLEERLSGRRQEPKDNVVRVDRLTLVGRRRVGG